MTDIKPLPQAPTPIKAGHYYRLKRDMQNVIGIPDGAVFFGIDLARPGSDRTVYIPTGSRSDEHG